MPTVSTHNSDFSISPVDSDAAFACAENLNREIPPTDVCETPEGVLPTSEVCAVVASMKRLVRGLSS